MCPLAVSRGYDERAKGTGGCISQALESLYISLGEGGSCATRRYGAVTLVSGYKSAGGSVGSVGVGRTRAPSETRVLGRGRKQKGARRSVAACLEE